MSEQRKTVLLRTISHSFTATAAGLFVLLAKPDSSLGVAFVGLAALSVVASVLVLVQRGS